MSARSPIAGMVCWCQQVEGTLADHILRGRQRRERKLQRIKDEIVRREQGTHRAAALSVPLFFS